MVFKKGFFTAKIRLLCGFVLLLLPLNKEIFAASLGPWYIGGSVGYTFPLKSNSSAKVFADPSYPNDNYQASSAKGGALLSLEGGRILHFQNKYVKSLLLGLAIQAGQLHEKGTITSLELPNQYTYDGKARFITLLAMSRIPIWQWTNIQTAISGLVGIGLSFNRAYSYNETPESGIPARNISIKNHQQTQFAYALGVSVDKVFTQHLVGFIRYEYLNAGDAQYGTVSTSKAQGPAIAVHMHTLSLGIRYQF